jgi:hypothetical protein
LERSLAQGGVSGRTLLSRDLVFAVADREDDPDIRALLAENALGGWVQLSLEREPDAFAADFGLSRSHAFIIARDRKTGAAVGVCERSVRDAFVDGEVRRLPYLASLRVAPAYRHRIRVLKSGFEAVRSLLHDPTDLPYALTSITAENDAARRVLCAGLFGLPTYRPVGEMFTFAMRTAVRAAPPGIEPARPGDLPAIAALLQRTYRRFQYAPVWRASDLERLLAGGGMRTSDFLIVRRGLGVSACLAVWDQGTVKQTVIRGYAPWLRRLRPFVNLASPLISMPRLPPSGSSLRQAYLSLVAVEDDDVAVFRAVLRAGLTLACRRGFEVALTGFATNHPFAAVLQRRHAVKYRSLLHLVHWRDTHPAVDVIASRTPHLEIAVM